MLSFKPLLLISLTHHELPHWWVHATLFPTTCWAMNICELTLAVSHPHRRRTGGSSGAKYRGVRFDLCGVSQLTFWRQGWILDPVIFIFYFVRLPLCNEYSDYCDIYLYTICYYMLSHPVLEGKPNAHHVRARISYSRTQQLHNMDIITPCSK
jgi:hypothetical protein